VFSDANTMLGKDSLKEIIKPFQDNKVGCVSGEKRIINKKTDSATGAGESFYWKFESFLKKLDSDFYSSVGAAGELFAIRTDLFPCIEKDTILDDFVISLKIALQGYIIKYTPKAFAIETASFDISEEMKRKVRIAAGCFQTLFRMGSLFDFFNHPKLTFQYVSHKVWRWTITPLCLFFIFPFVFIISFINGIFYRGNNIALIWSAVVIIVFILIMTGWLLRNKSIRLKILHGPFYFITTNYAILLGFFRYLKGKQSVVWEKAKRAGN
ncbi:MAG: glycosyltransferase family 2 protein, partial [Bacteroidota bacterium]